MTDVNQDPTLSSAHPDDALLAAYVDGTASAKERAPVAAHLESCATCRDDARMAKWGRWALRSLSEVPGPGLAGHLVLPDEAPSPAVEDLSARRGRATRWQRAAWATGLAAAASVAAILVLHAVGGTNSSTPMASRAARDGQTTTPVPARLDGKNNYTAETLAALARRLAAPGALAAAPTFGEKQSPAAGGPARSPGQSVIGSPGGAAPCAQHAAGLAGTVPPRYQESAAYQGTPAYIVGFVTTSGSRSSLLIVAASQDGCRALNVVLVAL